jgi:hypothetical protein
MMPSREGLAERLTTSVTENPRKFVEDIHSFRGVHPTYVRFPIQALQNVLATGQVDWIRIVPFLKWIVDQGEEFKGEAVKDRLDEDPDWRGARRALAYLLEGGFTQTATYIPFELREAAWEILAVLLRDSDPTLEDEALQIRTHEDASHMSINRTRGIAMHTVVRYALWVEKHFQGMIKSSDHDDQIKRSATGIVREKNVRQDIAFFQRAAVIRSRSNSVVRNHSFFENALETCPTGGYALPPSCRKGKVEVPVKMQIPE